jgi:hypothetical protein
MDRRKKRLWAVTRQCHNSGAVAVELNKAVQRQDNDGVSCQEEAKYAS